MCYMQVSRRFSIGGLLRKAPLTKDPACAFLQLSANWRHCCLFHFLLLKCLTPSSLTSHRSIRYSVLRQLSSLTDHPTYQLIAVSFRSHQPTQHFRPAPPREPTTATAKTHLRKVLSPYYTSLPPSPQQAHLTRPSRDRNAQNVRHRITPTEARGRRAPQH